MNGAFDALNGMDVKYRDPVARRHHQTDDAAHSAVPVNTEVSAVEGLNRMRGGGSFGPVCDEVAGIPFPPPAGKYIRHCFSHTFPAWASTSSSPFSSCQTQEAAHSRNHSARSRLMMMSHMTAKSSPWPLS